MRPNVSDVKSKWQKLVCRIIPSHRWTLLFTNYFIQSETGNFHFNRSIVAKNEKQLKSIVSFILDDEIGQNIFENKIENTEFISNVLFRSSRLPRYFAQLPIKSKMAYFNFWINSLFDAEQVKMVKFEHLSLSTRLDLRTRYFNEMNIFISEVIQLVRGCKLWSEFGPDSGSRSTKKSCQNF